MKKTRIVLASLFILSVATIICASTLMNANVGEVQFEERVIYGDASEVEGAIVNRNLKWEDKMYWRVTYVAGNSNATKTDYEFHMYERADAYEFFDEFLRFSDSRETFSFNSDMEPESGVLKAMADLYKESPNGEMSHKVIRLKDYEEYYSFGLSVDTGEFYFWIEPENEDSFTEREDLIKQREILKHFNQFFRIPVVENEFYQIGVNKDENGELTGFYSDHGRGTLISGDVDYDIELPENMDSFLFDIDAVNTKDTCYFTFQPYTSCGNLVDTSLIPGGYGIYSFKYDDRSVDEHSLKLEYSLEPFGYVSIKLDEQQENLLIFHEKENESGEVESYLTVLDLATMEEKQTISYGTIDEENLTRCYWIYDDFMIAQYDYYEAALLSRTEEGTYNIEFIIPGFSKVSEENYFLSGDNHFDWNGEKLVVAGEIDKVPDGYVEQEYIFTNPLTGGNEVVYQRYMAVCGFFLAVFDENGITYCGEYDCNLDTDWYSEKACTTIILNSLKVAWPKETQEN